MLKKITKNEKGVTLIEVLIALALTGIITAGFLAAISTAAKASFISEQQAIAENLARSQLENAKDQTYQEALPGGEVEYIEMVESYENFEIWSENRAGEVVGGETYNYIVAVPWNTDLNIASPNDTGLQKIKIVIKHQDTEIYSLEGYKVDDRQGPG